MTAKVVPVGSEQPSGKLRRQRQSSIDLAISMNSIQHNDEEAYADSGYGGARLDINSGAVWIQNNIKMRICKCYMPEGNGNICQCGHTKEEHTPTAQQRRKDENTKWQYNTCTEAVRTSAFGEIEFVGFGGNIGKFVRVDIDTNMPTMLELMTKLWGMETPNLLISVTGGANNFNMKPRLREVFRRGLMKVAQSTDAVSVPIVLLVLEGGPGTLETVENALKKNTPVVIIKDAIAAALVASVLLNAMSHRTNNMEFLTKIKENTNKFMKLAIGVLKECYSTDEKKAQCLLTRKLPQWGNTTCILIAVKAKNKQFISETACQDLFSNIWMGEMDHENRTWRVSKKHATREYSMVDTVIVSRSNRIPLTRCSNA